MEDRLDEAQVAADRAADRSILVAFGSLMAVEIVLGVLADAGTFGLLWWLVLAVGAVLVWGAGWWLRSRRPEPQTGAASGMSASTGTGPNRRRT